MEKFAISPILKGPVCGISSPFSGELADLQLAEHPLFHYLLQWLPKSRKLQMSLSRASDFRR